MMTRLLLLFAAYSAAVTGQTGLYTINTVAGVGRPTGDGGAASTALLNQPTGLATDSAGNIFFSDQGAHRIRKIDTAGKVTTVAGTGIRGNTGDGGPALQATIYSPAGLALDLAGNIYFADSARDVVRRVGTDGNITTVAGSAKTGFSGDGGPATAAQLNAPEAVAFFQGLLYIADTGNNRVRRVASNGVISTVAGTGDDFGSRLGGPGPNTPVSEPYGLAVDGAGTLYISEYGVDRVLKLDASLMLTPLAGTGQTGEAGDGGPALQAALNGPSGLTVDASGTVYVVDQDGGRVRRIANGIITAVAGLGKFGFSGDGGAPLGAQFAAPYGVALDPAGRLLVADVQNQRIRRIDIPNSIITTISGGSNSVGDGGPALNALLFSPAAVAFDSAGNLFVADDENHRVRKISPAGVITTVAGNGTGGFSGDGGDARSAQLRNPQGVAVDAAGNLLISDTGNRRIRRVNGSGTIQTVAGNGSRGFSGDGNAATLATLNEPLSLAFDALGNFYFADFGNNRIRKVTVVGQITTVAGSNTPKVLGDDGPAFAAGLLAPSGIVLDAAGNLYIADTFHNRVRKVAVNGTITTIAGTGDLGYTGDGGPATAAVLALPTAVTVDGAGNVFFTDALNGRVRRVSAAGVITTVGGNGGLGFSGDGGPALGAQLGFLASIAVDGTGTLFIADEDNHRIRSLTPAAALPDFTFTATSTALTVSSVNGFSGTILFGVKNKVITGFELTPVVLGAGKTVTVPLPAFTSTASLVTFTADSGSLHHEATIQVLPSITGPVLTSTGIANGASFLGGAVAPGEIVTIYGTGIGPSTLATLTLDNLGNVSSALAGTTVTFNGRPAPLLYVSASQLSAIVPYGLTAAAQLQVTYNGVASNTVTVPVVEASPALFTLNASGTGQAAVLNQGGTVNSAINAAAQGSVVVLYGTGEGETNPAGVDGQFASTVYPKPVLPVTVTVDGKAATVLYAGAAPQQVAGLFQLNIKLPDGVSSGAVPVVVTVGSRSSVPSGVTIAVQ